MASRKSIKAPAFQFYPKDFLTDERQLALSTAGAGIYIRLMCHCWLGDSLPNDPVILAKMAASDLDPFMTEWGHIAACFTQGKNGRLVHRRLLHEKSKQDHYRKLQRDKGVRSGAARARSVQPNVNHGSTGVEPSAVEPKGNSSISYLLSSTPVKREENVRVSLSSASRDPFTDSKVTERAGRFIDRYQELYPLHRHGARYAVKPARDYSAAVTLCETWTDDARLEKLAICFLTTDHKFAAEGSRTIPQFLALASWADGELSEWEQKQSKVRA